MASLRKRLLAVAALGLSVAVGGCMGDYGYGGVGYASGNYARYDPYGYGYGGGYGGWYDDFYYPGNGVYVYDRSGRRSRWNNSQKRHWQSRGRDRPGMGRPDRPNRGQAYGPGRRTPREGQQGVAPGPGARGDRGGARVERGNRPEVRSGQQRGREPGASMPQRGPDGGGRSRGGQGRGAGRGGGHPR